ncbi:hypothetical protein LEP1GSC166_2663 [Leptospira kirschneri]|nr:hypothetical protein LEP1GSC198_1101 [Leptospira kirschneri str. JB]EMK04116.1 hypothetical protein LEP1GSC166_2663 [Leptospira kirschneri]
MPCPTLRIFRIFFQESFVNITLHVGTHENPILFINHLNEFTEFRWILDFILTFYKYLSKNTLRVRQFSQKNIIVKF